MVVGSSPRGGTVEGDLCLVGGGDPLLGDRSLHRPTSPPGRSPTPRSRRSPTGGGDGRHAGDGDGRRRRQPLRRPALPRSLEPGLRSQNRVRTRQRPRPSNDGFTTGRSQGAPTPMRRSPLPTLRRHAAQVLADLLRARGVTVAGSGGRHGARRRSDHRVGASLPMAELRRRDAGLGSDNDTVGAARQGARRARGPVQGRPRPAAATSCAAGWRSSDRADRGLHVVDGSGLSRRNRVTCGFLPDLLTRPAPTGSLGEGLAVAGTDGHARRAVHRRRA